MSWTAADVASTCGLAKPAGAGWKCKCPLHEDKVASMTVTDKDGRVLVNCKAGCSQVALYAHVVKLMGSPGAKRGKGPGTRNKYVSQYPMPEPVSIKHRDLGEPVKTWEYRNAAGDLHFIICRFDTEAGKEFRPYTYKVNIDTGKIDYSWTGPDNGRIMYRRHLLSESGPVLAVEGEKAADAAGILIPEISVVSWCGGSKNWKYTDWTPLAGRTVWLWPDADEPGIMCMDDFAAHLIKLGCHVMYARNVQNAVTECHSGRAQIKGFDAADALADGWDHDKAITFLEMAQSADSQKSHADSQLNNADPHGQLADPHIKIANPQAENCESASKSCESAEINANPQIFTASDDANPQMFDANPRENGVLECESAIIGPITGANPQTFNADPQSAPANTVTSAGDFAKSLADVIKSKRLAGLPFLALGYNGDIYYYLSRETKQVKPITVPNHRKHFFTALVPNSNFWNGFVPPKPSAPDWDQVMERMMQMCHDAGLFEMDMVRGRGAWFDRDINGNDHVVLHLGNRLIVDGVECDILTRPGKFVYELSTPMEGPGTVAMSDADAQAILNIAHQFSWERPISAKYLAGWVALAPICGALYWRPHICITGAKGTGKSTIEERFILRLLGNMALSAQGNSTEAGIRQMLNHDAIPVLIDEAESEDERSRVRMDGIIQMMRQASSDSSAVTIKGGATGKASTYHIRSAFALSGIGVNIRRAADQSRITKLVLKRSTNDWREIERMLDTITEKSSKQLIKRIVSMIPVIRDNAKALAAEIARVAGDQRLGDQYGTLLAGAVAWEHSRHLTATEIAAIVAEHAAEFTTQATDMEHDETQCLDHLLQQIIRCDRSSGGVQSLTVGELVTIATRGSNSGVNQGEAQDILKRHGISLKHPCKTVKIARTHPQLAKLFAGTPWQAGWAQFLLRLPGAAVTGKTRFGGSPVNAFEVPLTYMEEMASEDAGLISETMPF